MILADLEAQERKFVANSRLKKAEKINFSWNLVPKKNVLLLPFFLKDPVFIFKKKSGENYKKAVNSNVNIWCSPAYTQFYLWHADDDLFAVQDPKWRLVKKIKALHV